MAYTTAITAASVGVTIPVKMLPRMMIGAKRAGKHSRKLRTTSRKPSIGSVGYPRRSAMTKEQIIKEMPTRMPGMIPAMNRSPRDTPETKA